MATLAEQIAALEAAMARGVRKVRDGDQEVEYRSRSDMAAELRRLKAQAGTQSGDALSVTYPTTSRGL